MDDSQNLFDALIEEIMFYDRNYDRNLEKSKLEFVGKTEGLPKLVEIVRVLRLLHTMKKYSYNKSDKPREPPKTYRSADGQTTADLYTR